MTKKFLTILLLVFMCVQFSACNMGGGGAKKKGSGGNSSPSGGNSPGGSGDKGGGGGPTGDSAPSGGVPEDSENHAQGPGAGDGTENPSVSDRPIDEGLPPGNGRIRDDQRSAIAKICEPLSADGKKISPEDFETNHGALFHIHQIAKAPANKLEDALRGFNAFLHAPPTQEETVPVPPSSLPRMSEALQCAAYFSSMATPKASPEATRRIVDLLIKDGEIDASKIIGLKIGDDFILNHAIKNGDLNFLDSVLTSLEADAGTDKKKWEAITQLLNQSDEEDGRSLLMKAIRLDKSVEDLKNEPRALPPQPLLTLRESIVARIISTGRKIRDAIPVPTPPLVETGDIFLVTDKLGLTPFQIAQNSYAEEARLGPSSTELEDGDPGKEIDIRRRIMESLIDGFPDAIVANALDNEKVINPFFELHGPDGLGKGANGPSHAQTAARTLAKMNQRRDSVNPKLAKFDPVADPEPTPGIPNPRASRKDWEIYKTLSTIPDALPESKPVFDKNGPNSFAVLQKNLTDHVSELKKLIESLRDKQKKDPRAFALLEFEKFTNSTDRKTALATFQAAAPDAPITEPIKQYQQFLGWVKEMRLKEAKFENGEYFFPVLDEETEPKLSEVTSNPYARAYWEIHKRLARLTKSKVLVGEKPTAIAEDIAFLKARGIVDEAGTELIKIGETPEKVVSIIQEGTFESAVNTDKTLTLLEDSLAAFNATTGIQARASNIFGPETFKNINAMADFLKQTADRLNTNRTFDGHVALNERLTARRDEVKKIAERLATLSLSRGITSKKDGGKDVVEIDGNPTQVIKLEDFKALLESVPVDLNQGDEF